MCTGERENEIQVLEAIHRQRLDTLLEEAKAREANMGEYTSVQRGNLKYAVSNELWFSATSLAAYFLLMACFRESLSHSPLQTKTQHINTRPQLQA